MQAFLSANGIRQAIIDMKGTKKETIPLKTMKSILSVVLDRQNYPLLLHCNHGKHRTGCVVAVVRKLSGWNLERVLDEYREFAAPKIRECDVEYISDFQVATLQQRLGEGHLALSPVQVKAFCRSLLFTAFVLILWLVSGSRMAVADKDKLVHVRSASY